MKGAARPNRIWRTCSSRIQRVFLISVARRIYFLCHCECDGVAGPTDAAPIPILAPADDASQATGQATATLDAHTLVLGQGNTVGLRFLLGVPPGSHIDAAVLQFKASNSDNGPSDLTIRAVNAGNVAEFTSTTELNGFGSSLSDPIQWIPPAWTAGSEDVKTDAAHGLVTAQDLRDLLQTVVSRNDYTPQSFVAFLITGSGTRRAWAFEGQGDNKKDPGKPAKL